MLSHTLKSSVILNHSHPEVTLRYIGTSDEGIENNLKNFVL